MEAIIFNQQQQQQPCFQVQKCQQQLDKSQWFVQPVPKNLINQTVGVKIPMNIEVVNDLMTPVELKQQLQMLELGLTNTRQQQQQQQQMLQQFNLPQMTRIQQLQKRIACMPWSETVELQSLPINKLRVFYAPQEGAIVVKLRIARQFNRFGTEQPQIDLLNQQQQLQQLIQQQIQQLPIVDQEFCPTGVQGLNNLEQQLQSQQWQQQAQGGFITYKKVIQIPRGVCPQTLRVQFNKQRQVLLIVSVIELPREDEEVLSRNVDCMSQAALIKKLVEKRIMCNQCNEMTAEPCQPRNLIVPLRQLLADCQNDERYITKNLLKYIICQQAPELFYASKKIRDCFKMLKQTCFQNMMKTPTFIRVPHTKEHRLRLEFILPGFAPEAIKVTIVDERKRIVMIEARREVRCPTTGQILANECINRQLVVPQLVDLERMLHNYEEKAGVLTVTFPVNQERSQHYYRQLLNHF